MKSTQIQNKKKRFSAIDLVIVILLVCAVAGMCLRAVDAETGFVSGESEAYYITYIVSAVDSDISAMLSDGTKLYTENEKPFGSIEGNVITTPAQISGENDDGEYVQGHSSSGIVDVKGTISVSGIVNDRGLYVEGKYYAPNMKVSLLGGGTSLEILILDIVKAA